MDLKLFVVLCCLLLSTSLGKEVYDSRLDNVESLKYDFSTLLNVSLASERGHREASAVFKWNYGKFLIEISHDTREIYSCWKQMYVHYEATERFLKGFGKLFEKLSVAYNFIPLNKQNEISKYINEYCSETLVEFKAKYIEEGAFDNMKKPFTKVKYVALDGAWKNIDSNSLGLEELFPEMRLLNLTYSGGYILDRVFPKLVELNGDIKPSPAFVKFIQKHSQLKRLRLKSTSVDVLRAIDKLPELDILAFHVPSDMESHEDNPVIHFQHIKDVAITDVDLFIKSGNITFKQLKKLQLTVFENLDDVWIDFIGQNKDLETLIITTEYLNNSTLLTLASKLNKLVEANVRCDFGIDIESVVVFLESNPNIKTLTLNFSKGSVSYFIALADRLSTSESLKDFQVAPVNKRFDGIQISRTIPPNGASYIFASSTLVVTLMAVAFNVFAF